MSYAEGRIQSRSEPDVRKEGRIIGSAMRRLNLQRQINRRLEMVLHDMRVAPPSSARINDDESGRPLMETLDQLEVEQDQTLTLINELESLTAR